MTALTLCAGYEHLRENQETYLSIKCSSDSRCLCSNCERCSALLCKASMANNGTAPPGAQPALRFRELYADDVYSGAERLRVDHARVI